MTDTIKNIKQKTTPSRVKLVIHPVMVLQLIRHGVSFVSFPPTDLSSQIQRGGGTKTRSATQRSQSTPCITNDIVLRGDVKSGSQMVEAKQVRSEGSFS